MTMPTRGRVDAMLREGAAALRRGDLATARARLWPLKSDAGGIAPWLLIAQTAQGLGDIAEAEAALEALLRIEPRNLAGLLLLAASKASGGDDRAAQSLYRTALNIATQPGAQVAPGLVPLLRLGETLLVEVEKRFAAHLEQAIADLGLGAGAGGARIRQSLDLLLGRSEVYLQQPSMFYFPGLAQRAFFERNEFAWLAGVERAIPAMRAELEAVIAESVGFAPYVQATPGRALPANPLLDDPRWSAFHLWRAGEIVPENAARCPATMAALGLAPMPVIAGRSPMAIFSRLEPGTHIRPHHGMLNTRLICHVPLIAPEGCGLRVGAETRTWQEGEALVFDDSIEHEAWNRGTRTRVVLLFEIWRPELSDVERAALMEIFTTIDSYQGAVTDAG
ncbi:aspartyl/asparaginyl beta-hydroxylase domain-containing protein [Sphingomonas sp.]|uniref:aspartyl/asparaginyl beta-hydroxylase domain-containing protein n=1 Tax=Sphingomonas sp. TaxID=28214 RepID=UPI0035BC0462